MPDYLKNIVLTLGILLLSALLGIGPALSQEQPPEVKKEPLQEVTAEAG